MFFFQAIMMFSICGSRTEAMGDKMTAYSLYLQTLSIIKFVHKLTNSSRNNNQDVDTRYNIMPCFELSFIVTNVYLGLLCCLYALSPSLTSNFIK